MSSLERLVAGGLVRREVPLGPLTTYRFGGPAAHYAEPGNLDELGLLLDAAGADGEDVVVLGRGSNVVVSASGLPGLVLRLTGTFAEFDLDADGIVTAGAAVPLPRLARATVEEGRAGLEFFVGIPGSVGGAVRMNAGCFGTDTSERLVDARIVDVRSGALRTAPVESLSMSYRSTSVGPDEIVVSARFATEPGDPEVGRERLREITRWRRDHQPGGTHNAGSVFKNPPGDTAGRLIDSLGLKGFAVGGAQVSPRHANFFEAGDEATPDDVFGLVGEIRRRVAAETGVELEPEIRFLGRFGTAAGGAS